MICEELIELQKISADDMRKSVYENYTVFIRFLHIFSFLLGPGSSNRSFLHGLDLSIQLPKHDFCRLFDTVEIWATLLGLYS